jgi:hypothetical protein
MRQLYTTILAIFVSIPFASFAVDERIQVIPVDLRESLEPFRMTWERDTTPRVQVPVQRNRFPVPAAELVGWTGVLYYAESDTETEGMSIEGTLSGNVFDFVIPSDRVYSNGTYFAQLLFRLPGDERVQEWRRGTLTIRGGGGADPGAANWNVIKIGDWSNITKYTNTATHSANRPDGATITSVTQPDGSEVWTAIGAAPDLEIGDGLHGLGTVASPLDVVQSIKDGAAAGAMAYQPADDFDYAWITNQPSLFTPNDLPTDYGTDWTTLTSSIAAKQDAGDYVTQTDSTYTQTVARAALALTNDTNFANLDGDNVFTGPTNTFTGDVEIGKDLKVAGDSYSKTATVNDGTVMELAAFSVGEVNQTYVLTGEANGRPEYTGEIYPEWVIYWDTIYPAWSISSSFSGEYVIAE